MKVLILFAFCVASEATVLLHHPAVLSTGASSQYRSQDNLGNYNFGYNEGHVTGGTFRREAGDGHGNVAGSYGLRDADGRLRIVNYVADAAGFRADVKTNEPGVDSSKDPADTTVNKAALVAAPAYHPIVYAHAPAVAYAHAPAMAYATHHIGAPFYSYGYHY